MPSYPSYSTVSAISHSFGPLTLVFSLMLIATDCIACCQITSTTSDFITCAPFHIVSLYLIFVLAYMSVTYKYTCIGLIKRPVNLCRCPLFLLFFLSVVIPSCSLTSQGLPCLAHLCLILGLLALLFSFTLRSSDLLSCAHLVHPTLSSAQT